MEADSDIGINQTGTSGVYTKQPADNTPTKIKGVDLSGARGGDASVDDIRAVVFSKSSSLRGDTCYITLGGQNTPAATGESSHPRTSRPTRVARIR